MKEREIHSHIFFPILKYNKYNPEEGYVETGIAEGIEEIIQAGDSRKLSENIENTRT